MRKKIRVGILGCGGMAGAHAMRFKANPNVRIVALCGVAEERVKAFADRALADYRLAPAIYTDPARMYKESKLDAVAIVTPHTLHFKEGIHALDAGLHVLMEKPMVTDSGHAHALARKVKKAGKIFMIAYNTPCSPEFFFLREAIRQKTYGNLEMVVGYLSQDWMRRTKGSWRQDPKRSGGGQAYDSGAHLLNSLCWSVESDIAEVFAFMDNHGAKVDINSTINVKFANGVTAAIAVSGNSPGHGTFMAFMFDNGRIEIDGWDASWMNVFDRAGRVKYPVVPGKPQTPNDNFIDAILGRAEPRTTVRNGIIHSELMDAIYESVRTGKPARPRKHP
ncbi:MAG: Gfo/Idh/MocA family oxidoreductase [Kiritimatiellae bacterium]|nr:Gfo/Idh/MocA family oxidoreductase [Verrucomicrobiota bacterium]MCG2659170.1 Gfo/Idh/MocA family oxidoreductase [Kiritimatiellia bacterium]